MIFQLWKHRDRDGRVIDGRGCSIGPGPRAMAMFNVRPGESRFGVDFEELWKGPDAIEVLDDGRAVPYEPPPRD